DKVPLKMEFLRKKLKWIQQTMREQGIDIWITFTREGNEDPLAQDLRFSDLTWRSAAIIDQDGTKTAVVGSLEVDTIRQNKFYDAVEDAIRPGKRDKYVHEFAHKLVAEKGLSTAWAYDRCPSVNVAGNPMGHIGYHNAIIRNGDFVKLDFGVNYEGYCSDIQRGYFVGPGNIPSSVKRMFETARAANDAALAVLKPGAIGYKVDSAGRKLSVKKGYPEYKHALGHVLGRSTHEIGPLLGPRWPNRYGKQVE